jgi:hypothetical protein
MEGTMTVPASQPAPQRRTSPRAKDTSSAIPSPEESDSSSLPSEALTPVAPIDTITLVSGQGQQGAGFSFKVQATGALFRCQVMRSPNQPRFWCITIYLCLDGGSPDKDQPRWISNDLLTREEMPEALAAVQADVAGWLSDSSRADLRKWVLAQTSRSPMASNPRFAGAVPAS